MINSLGAKSGHSLVRRGFTIVELLIVVVVIAILAAITIVAFNGIQRQAAGATVDSDLRNVGNVMGIKYAASGEYPTQIPAELKSSPGIELTLMGGGVFYENLTPRQNAALFFDTCADLIASGGGQKPDDNNHYVSECRVYNTNQIQVNGWNGRDIGVPVTKAKLDTYVTSYTGGNKAQWLIKGQEFMDQWESKFTAAGGAFPVTSFWDSWATPGNGGVMKPALPAPIVTGGDANSYCVEAKHSKYNITKHVRSDGGISEGGC